MKENLLYTPEGVRDIYGEELQKRLLCMDKLERTLAGFGYREIETPSYEYFDIFNLEKGSAQSNEMFKFFDRDNNTLVLRPDITPSIARCVAKYYAEESLPVRLCYQGRTFTNTPKHQGKLSQTTQIGAELINDQSSAADAEVIACAIRCLLAVGFTDFMIEIGDISFFRGIVREAGLDGEKEEKLKAFILSKNFYGLREYAEGLGMPEPLTRLFSEYDNLFGGVEVLDRAEALVQNETSLAAVSRLRKVYRALLSYGYEGHVGFDLSMLNRYHYYTGIQFAGYTYGTGDAVLKGGRYDDLMACFGKDAPAVGFAIYLDDLMNAVIRNNLPMDIQREHIVIIYDREVQEQAIKKAVSLRNEGKTAELIRKSSRADLKEYKSYARRMGVTKIISFSEDGEHEIFDICAG